MTEPWPYAIPDLEAISGVIKSDYGDFLVEEIPAYEPCGSGDHVYFRVEKRGLSTPRAIRDIARALGVRPGEIGVAGMKDARGVTRQTLSLEHADPAAVEALDIPRIAVLSVSRHRNKLRMGHLRGNRFAIRLREIDPGACGEIRLRAERLAARGAPNYFGPQRFGYRGDTGRIGGALLRGDFAEAAALIAGRPGPLDTGDLGRARELFDAGRYAEARSTWPRGFHECAELCRRMAGGADARRAVLGLDRRALGLYVSAFQSHLFNRVVAARVDRLDRVEAGDLAFKHDSGAVFPVEEPEREQSRADRFEISATGPIFGHKMSEPRGAPAELERRVLAEEAIPAEQPRSGPLSAPGARRPLRFRPEGGACEPGEDAAGRFVELRFALPKGCYATAFLREILRDGLSEAAPGAPDAPAEGNCDF